MMYVVTSDASSNLLDDLGEKLSGVLSVEQSLPRLGDVLELRLYNCLSLGVDDSAVLQPSSHLADGLGKDRNVIQQEHT